MKDREDPAADGGRARYGGDGPATGSNEPKGGERKERDPDWVPRQGGDQTRSRGGDRGEDPQERR
jgi:hypothetical protein